MTTRFESSKTSTGFEDFLRRAYVFALGLCILLDGGAKYFGATLSCLLFAAILIGTAFSDLHRTILIRARVGALAIALAIVAVAVWQVIWDPTGETAHSAWQLLREPFGSTGGTRSINRLQPLWEVPGTILPFIAFAAAVPLFRRDQHVRRLWASLATLGAVFATFGLLQLIFFPGWQVFEPKNYYIGNLTGFYVNRNIAAAFLAMTLLVTAVFVDISTRHSNLRTFRRVFLERASLSPGERRIAVWVCAFVVQALALMMTRSRAGALVGTAATLVYFAITHREALRAYASRASRSRLILLLAIPLVGVLMLLAPILRRVEAQGFTDTRWCAYPSMVRMAWDNLPWGVGLGGFVSAYPGYRQADCGIFAVWEHAHNSYIQGFATIGLAFPVLFVFGALLALWPLRSATKAPRETVRHIAIATWLAIIAMALHSFVDFPLEIPGNAILLGTLIASCLGAASERIGDTAKMRSHGDRHKHPPRTAAQAARKSPIE